MIGAVMVVVAVTLTIRARCSWPGMTSPTALLALISGGVVAILVTGLGPFASDWAVPVTRSAAMIGIVLGLCDVLDSGGPESPGLPRGRNRDPDANAAPARGRRRVGRRRDR